MAVKPYKPYKVLERVVRGFSNHRRIQIMALLDKSPELSVLEVAARLRINVKTASAHLTRLAVAGLVIKRHEGAAVRHKVTDRGQDVLKFLRTLE